MLLIYLGESTKMWQILNPISLNEDGYGYFKDKQTTFVQSNKTQVYSSV